MKINKKPVKDIEYVELYAEKLREDNGFFKQQKELINSQISSSSLIFKNKFGEGEVFKKKAREYLRKVGLINN